MSKVSQFKILPKHMLASNRDFPIVSACNNDFKLWRQKDVFCVIRCVLCLCRIIKLNIHNLDQIIDLVV